MGTATTTSLAERFWANVKKNGEGECWEWLGNTSTCGYAALGHRRTMHRFSYELHLGPILDGMRVCHRCDNPPCCNPDHLFLGTAADNSRDMVLKGRSNRGERNGNARLTEPDVLRIRSLRAEGLTLKSIAAECGVSFQAVHDITTRRRWGHI